MSEYIIECDYDFDEGWIPGEHREEIVRCRDCTNKQPYDEPMGCDCLCGLLWIEVEPDGFCKWGERK